MIRIVKSAALGMAVAATTLSGIPAANAGRNHTSSPSSTNRSTVQSSKAQRRLPGRSG